ncbi:ribonuclease E inhibitor RraB [Demequina aurantiaca]|uniref:ribonuclease E inhibitor RraB n=1 Tax=Demequina aurantiaca TaxID=676200 RepID=UPI000783485C|nr:ribonuclease E inhibitor RraB [Demequina aurantiaca]
MGLFSSSKKRVEPHGLLKDDAEQLARLESRGVDITAPRESEFAVCFKTQATADAAADSLRTDRVCHEVVLPSHDVPEWTIMLTVRNQPLVPDFLRDRVDLCIALADAHKGEYEGWVALLTDDEKDAI